MAPRKLQLRIIYDVDGWAYHRNAMALHKYCPPQFEITSMPWPTTDPDSALGDEPLDFVFLMDKSKTAIIRKLIDERGGHSALVVKWSNGWPHRIDLFHQCYRDADLLVINNKLYWDMTGGLPRTAYLPNGVDHETFRVVRPICDRETRVLWVGSRSRRTLKGYDNYLAPLQEELDRRGIAHDFQLVDSYGGQVKPAEEMAEWYNNGTILVCASSSEGTPNPALEAAACGCTVVSTRVGNMPELIRNGVNGYLVERDRDSIARAIAKAARKYPQLSGRMQRDIARWTWEKRSRQFFRLLRELKKEKFVSRRPVTPLNGIQVRTPASEPPSAAVPRAASAPSSVDLRDKVTAFVATCGERSTSACLICIEQQDAQATIEVIENRTPFSEAYREMLRRCRTPYFIQVDADMLLYPRAFRTLFHLIADRPANTALLSAGLHDVHLDRPIHGIKIFNHKIAADFPPRDCSRWHARRNDELEGSGYRCERLPLFDGSPGEPSVLGLHSPFYDRQSIFNRYFRLQRDRRLHPRELKWFDEYPSIFLMRFLSDPTPLNYCALMGVIAGSLEKGDDTGSLGNETVKIGADLPDLRHLIATRSAILKNRGAKPGRNDTRVGMVDPMKTACAENAPLPSQLSEILTANGLSPTAVEMVTALPSPKMLHGSFKAVCDGGRTVKLRVVETSEQADRVAAIVSALPERHFPKILARRENALIEEWIPGRCAAEDRYDSVLLQQAGALLARIHATPAPRYSYPALRTIGDRLKRLQRQTGELHQRGHLTRQEVSLVMELARRREPPGVEAGLVHRDFAADNLVVGEDGVIWAVDNETMTYDALCFDLARTWYRWPLAGQALSQFLNGYQGIRPAADFEPHFVFWALSALVDACLFRVRAETPNRDYPLRRLRSLIADVEAGESGFRQDSMPVPVMHEGRAI